MESLTIKQKAATIKAQASIINDELSLKQQDAFESKYKEVLPLLRNSKISYKVVSQKIVFYKESLLGKIKLHSRIDDDGTVSRGYNLPISPSDLILILSKWENKTTRILIKRFFVIAVVAVACKLCYDACRELLEPGHSTMDFIGRVSFIVSCFAVALGMVLILATFKDDEI